MDPGPQRSEDITRISIDTLQDWQRVRANYTAAAMQVFNEEMANSMDDLSGERQVLERYMQQFIQSTFEMTRENLRVNGRNYEDVEMDEEEEPFDEGLDRHIWALSEQSLKWDREIAQKRRETPREVERLIGELLERQREVDADEDASENQEDVDMAGGAIPKADPALEAALERTTKVATRVEAMVAKLQQKVPLQTERTERVQTVAAEVKALKS
ncbi:hypothetical protein WOLCODRAFT_141311 [Wolfiporia cocos MD-104 SS10]|uniref:Uncharacterized protein n=1 Tax=Wolfiporia cocos (strain MD-104) TaxID=742152 RepID=A0A2H3JBF1_WOLCO|nr:hypothetical protein WOLCODRAFT_141311 [Wolfiporia cocos MD-104 SS10]